MAREKSIYVCTECGGTSAKWLGKCPQCEAWNTLVESVAESAAKPRYAQAPRGLLPAEAVMTLSEIDATDAERQPTGIEEFDRALGGGIVAGGVVLIGGDPGIGKSTLLLQALDALARTMKALYVTGEESGAQVALRSRRLGLGSSAVRVLAEIQLEKILATLESEAPAVAVIDSIQTVYSEALTSAPGSVAQVRECAAQLTRFAKASGTTIVLVGHVTKDGALAGPRVMEHIVDTVLYFEGDTHSSFRLVRAIKNRFGAVNEIGVFAMTEKGLKGVGNPSAIFLSTHGEPVPGSCVLVTLEGTRPMLVEVQALVDAGGPSPRRLSVGLERDRLAMMLAVLHRHAGIAGRSIRTCSSTPSAACASASRPPTWRSCWRSSRACAASRCRAASSPSARLAWPARCGRRRAARSACARPPSSASRSPSCPRRTRPRAPRRRPSKA